jgi:hypothetical protein
VDDQPETYTVEVLNTLKANHEKWVFRMLSDMNPQPVRIRRIKQNIPTYLTRLTTGQELMNIVGDACSLSFEHDELESRKEVEIISGFAEEIQDWGDLSAEFAAGERVNAAHRISAMLRELEVEGFWVFGAREVQRIEGGIATSSSWPVAIVRVVRASSPEIKRIAFKVKAEDDGPHKKTLTSEALQ